MHLTHRWHPSHPHSSSSAIKKNAWVSWDQPTPYLGSPPPFRGFGFPLQLLLRPAAAAAAAIRPASLGRNKYLFKYLTRLRLQPRIESRPTQSRRLVDWIWYIPINVQVNIYPYWIHSHWSPTPMPRSIHTLHPRSHSTITPTRSFNQNLTHMIKFILTKPSISIRELIFISLNIYLYILIITLLLGYYFSAIQPWSSRGAAHWLTQTFIRSTLPPCPTPDQGVVAVRTITRISKTITLSHTTRLYKSK